MTSTPIPSSCPSCLRGESISSRVLLAADLVRADTPGDYIATAITQGEGNGLLYSADVLHASLKLWEGASVFVDHAGPADWGRPGGRSIKDLAGVFHSVHWDDVKQGISGTLTLLATHHWLTAIINECLALRQGGRPTPKLGLSADLHIERRGNQVTHIVQVYSLDVVMNPARGGSIEAAASDAAASDAALSETTSPVAPDQERATCEVYERRLMSEQPAEYQVAPPAANTPTLASRVTLGGPPPGDNPPAPVAQAAASTPPNPPNGGPLTPDAPLAADLQRQTLAALLEVRLASSPLPDPFKADLRARLASRVYGVDDLDAELQRATRLASQLAESQTVRHLGVPRVDALLTSADRLQLALERLLGAPLPDSASDIPRLSGIREFYHLTTGDYEMTGQFRPERVSLANVTVATMSSIVKNALNKVLLHAFEMRAFWWRPIVWEEDFHTLNDVTWITAGGFGDLPTVAEGAAYTELGSPTDIEETSAFLKKGGYIGITLETIDRDNVALIRAIPRKLGIAANRTLSAAVAAIFTQASGVGPTLGQDSKALFHTDHGNLGSTALATASWDAAVQAVYKQAEAGSAERMGLRPAYIIVPIELEYTARQLMDSAEFTGGSSAVLVNNPRYRSAGVIVCPEFTDANDWAAVVNPVDCPGICVGYRYGRAPELFVADDPLTGSMFTNDALRLKVRFYYTVGVGEYRALYKANVT
jgi:hypothetical protein